MQARSLSTTAGVSVSVERQVSRRRLAGTYAPLLSAALAGIVASAALLVTAVPAIAQNTGANEMNQSIKPGDDFYGYANGGWLATASIPAGQASYDTRAILTEKTSLQVRDLIQGASASHPAKGSVAQKVGDYYASFMDEAAIEAKGLTPLRDELARISAIANKASLSAYLGTTLTGEVDGLTANADHIFGLWVNQDFEDADHNVVHLWQGGLGMPDRDDYLDPSPKMAALRAQYQTQIAAVLKLAGVDDAESKSARVLSLEVRIAQLSRPTPMPLTSSSRTTPEADRLRRQGAGHLLGCLFCIGWTRRAVRLRRVATIGHKWRIRFGRQ